MENKPWSVSDYQNFVAKKAQEEKAGKKKSKYKNKWTTRDGIKFQSVREADEYTELTRRVRAGDILKFDRQKKYEFIVNGVKVSSYKADFVVYHHDGSREVVDVKSPITRTLNDYVIRRKLMLALFGIKVIEK